MVRFLFLKNNNIVKKVYTLENLKFKKVKKLVGSKHFEYRELNSKEDTPFQKVGGKKDFKVFKEFCLDKEIVVLKNSAFIGPRKGAKKSSPFWSYIIYVLVIIIMARLLGLVSFVFFGGFGPIILFLSLIYLYKTDSKKFWEFPQKITDKINDVIFY